MGVKDLKCAGIDYGSKLAGTTSICYAENGRMRFVRSAKKKDADRMIRDFCQEFQPDLIALDAPLSLPGVYSNISGCEDYFYRSADKELKAMSPMFIGGLTARAMKLKAELLPTQVIEVYPVFRAKTLELKSLGYRGKEADYEGLCAKLEVELYSYELSSHDFDAVLAYEIGSRYLKDEAQKVGRQEEGFIYY